MGFRELWSTISWLVRLSPSWTLASRPRTATPRLALPAARPRLTLVNPGRQNVWNASPSIQLCKAVPVQPMLQRFIHQLFPRINTLLVPGTPYIAQRAMPSMGIGYGRPLAISVRLGLFSSSFGGTARYPSWILRLSMPALLLTPPIAVRRGFTFGLATMPSPPTLASLLTKKMPAHNMTATAAFAAFASRDVLRRGDGLDTFVLPRATAAIRHRNPKARNVTKLNSTLNRALNMPPPGLAQAAIATTANPYLLERKQYRPTTEKTGMDASSIVMSISLYGPPEWDIDTIGSNDGAPQTLTRDIIAEIRHLAHLHARHLTVASSIMDTLLRNGIADMQIRKEDSGIYELTVMFPASLSMGNVMFRLAEMGIDPCSPSFRLERQTNCDQNSAARNDRPAHLDDGDASVQRLFPWSQTAPRPNPRASGQARLDHFVQMVDELMHSSSMAFAFAPIR